MSEDLEILCKKADELFKEEKFADIISLLNDEVLEKYRSAELYAWRARAYNVINDDTGKNSYYAQKAIDTDPGYYMGYFARGCGWYNKGEYENAIADYSKTIDLQADYAYAYNNRGLAWDNQYEYDKAIADYNNAIDLKPDYAVAYNNRGNAWLNKSEYDKAITDYNNAIDLKPDYAVAYYNRGLSFQQSGKNIAQAINDFTKFLELAADKDKTWVKRAKDYIKELRAELKDAALKEIGDLTSEIKKLLLSTDGCVTHYTGLSVAKKLLFDDSKFRMSEGSFLNDTSEGTELFNFLQYQFISDCKDTKTPAAFVPKPFIGSFVAESKHDDLNLWRFYGKENNEEAKGCAITIRMKEFIVAINESLGVGRQKSDPGNESDIKFYRVAYWDHITDKINFVIPNSRRKVETELNKLMGDLKDKVKNYRAEDKSNLEKYLNSIAFLFKSDAYKNENEIRLVVKGIEFEKKFDTDANPPRVYIELVNIRDVMETITLGPKVDKPDEWAAAIHFRYDNELDAKKKPGKILISRLPYK